MGTDRKMTKSAGEHWVCAVLAGLGWAPALTRDGIVRTDLLAVNCETGVMISTQVKATRSASPSFMFGARATDPSRSSNEWYILVWFHGRPWQAPLSFVVPRDHVAAGVHISYKDWLTDPSASPGSRNTPLDVARIGAGVFEGYEGRWGLLDRAGSLAPVMLPHSFRELAVSDRVGLPDGHPWTMSLPEW